MANIGDLAFRIMADWAGFQKQAEAEGAKAGDAAAGGFTDKWGKKIAALATGAFVAGITKGLVDLDTATKQYQADVGATGEEAEKAKAKTLDLWKSNTQSMQEIMTTMAKLRTDQGQTQQGAEDLAQSYLDFAKVAGTTAPDAVTTFDDLLDAWGLTAQDAAGIMDQLVASHQKYGGSIMENAASLRSLAPRLKALGVDINGAIGLLNLFQSAGVNSGEAMRGLQTAITKLKPGQTLDDLIAQITSIEDPTKRATAAADIFGGRAGAVLANALKPGITSLKDFEVSAGDAAGATKTAADTINSSLPVQFQLFFQNLSGQLIGFVAAGGPIFTFIGGLATMTSAFDLLSVHAAAAWLAVLGPLALVAAAIGVVVVALASQNQELEKQKAILSDTRIDNYIYGVRELERAVAAGAMSSADLNAESYKLQQSLHLTAAEVVEARRKMMEGAQGAAEMGAAFDDATSSLGEHAGAEQTAAEAAGATAAATRDNAAAHDDEGAATDKASSYMTAAARQAAVEEAQISALVQTMAAGYGTTISYGDAALYVARGMNAAAIQAQLAAAAIAAFNRSHPINPQAPPGSADTMRQFSVGTMNTEVGDFDPDALAAYNKGLGENFGYKPPKKKTGGGGKKTGKSDAAKQAEKDAAEALKAWQDAEKKRLADAKEKGDQYLAYVHQKNLKAIADDRDAAMKAIDASHKQALAKIEDRRKEAQAAYEAARADIYKPVQAAEAALAEKQYQRDLAAARKEAADAAASGDQERIQSANDRLSDLQTQHDIEAMRAAADAQAEQLDAAKKAQDEAFDAEVQAENDKYDAARKAEDDLYQLQVDQENKRFEDSKAAYQKQYDALVQNLDDTKTMTDKKLNEATVSFYAHGLAMGKNLAAGLKASQAEVEKAAKDLADTVTAYTKTGSPAEKGPLHDNPPDVMGERIGFLLAAGIREGFKAEINDIRAAIGAFAGGVVNPMGRVPMAGGYDMEGEWGAVRQGHPDLTVVVNNPYPEPASVSVHEQLQVLAVTGVLG